ncbi:F0F1 ATP synthase subunit B [Kitasatospora sp. NPDC057015]|uniref:F0F1 ATP synthase subunit B family protein n=1 Tax=Kitasatospora sp. NPDC057015 TaxID=3346001 RepID=UPI0036322BF2
MGPLEPDPAELVIGLLCFFLIFGLLGRIILPRLERTLADRRYAIEGGVERAEADQAEALRTLAAYRRELADAHHEAARIRQAAAEEGAALLAAAREEGHRERAELVAAARARLSVDRELARVSLRAAIGPLSTDLAGRIVGEPLDAFAARHGSVERFLEGR